MNLCKYSYWVSIQQHAVDNLYYFYGVIFVVR